MRESVGGAWLFGIVIVFITLFSGFLTYSISYTKAFNVKNQMISYIEEDDGYIPFDGTADISVDISTASDNVLEETTEGRIYKYMRNIGYNHSVETSCAEGEVERDGYCIRKMCADDGVKNANTHYKVRTFISLEIPFLGITVRIPISGETRNIYKDRSGMDCSTTIQTN